MSRTKPYLNGNVVDERIYMGIIYKDSTTYDFNKVIEVLTSYPDYAFIEHDMDGVKTHTHILFRFDSRRQINTVAEELGIPETVLKWRDSFRLSMQYLTHENKKNLSLPEEERKYVYSRTKITSSFDDDKLNKFFDKTQQEKIDDEISQVMMIVDEIEKSSIRNYRDLIRWSCKNKCWTTLRRGGQHFIKAFDEVRNERIKDEFQKKFDKKIEDGKYKKDDSDVQLNFTVDNSISF